MSETEQRDQDLIQVGDWMKRLSETGVVGVIDRDTLDRTFDSLGASMEITADEEKSLKKYTNKASRDGMVAVWGEDRIKAFSEFCQNWVLEFEDKEGNVELPRLDKSGRKDSGMKQFFHEITAYAYGILGRDEFITIIEARIENGKLWQEGKKDERIKLTTPTSEGKKILVGSIPPGFISDFWDWLRTSGR